MKKDYNPNPQDSNQPNFEYVTEIADSKNIGEFEVCMN